YPELLGYSRQEIYQDFFGGGGLYLATRIARTMRLQPDDNVLDLGCGTGSSSIFLAKHYSVRVTALDLWTSAEFLRQKFSALGLSERILPIQRDATQPLPFARNYFDSIFCMNSFSFYGGNLEFIERLLTHLKPGGQLCIGSEVLTSEFSAKQIADPPPVYSFQLPPPNEHVDVFADDFKKQHTARWWRELFESSGRVEIEHCEDIEEADAIYEELVRYEHEHNIDPFDVQICLDQMEWGRTHEPRKTLFVMTVRKT
ncbi:MAG TPA: methyltransferase domain-containing protein, partial [Anaerolineales bacterium]|nr:methyltransferase domain-containing protein [Anaerolineales bacterium]